MVSHSTLDSLLPELQLQIGSYLTDVDLTTLSLTCRRLYAIHAPKLLDDLPRRSFWTMILTDDDGIRQAMLKQWTTRIQVLPLLHRWAKRVVGHALERNGQADSVDLLDEWEICGGCTSFKIQKDGWVDYGEDAYTHVDMIEQYPIFDDFTGENLSIILGHVLQSSFCKSCVGEWEELECREDETDMIDFYDT